MATWVFDVDGTLVDSLTGTALRPGAAELLRELHEAGERLVVWSAGGADHARDRLTEHGVDHLVAAFLPKGDRGDDGRYRRPGAATPGPVVFVDDHPEDLPVGAHVVGVSPFIAPNPHDRALASVRGVVDRLVG